MTTTTATIQAADGAGLQVVTWPNEEARASLLLVHGISEHMGRWEHVAAFMTSRGLEVHGYDHRGHGKSGGPRMDCDHFGRYVEDLEQVVRAVQRADRPLVIYAHSMGGLIAVLYAESARPQPDYYVFSAPALEGNAPAWMKVGAKLASRVAPGLRVKSPIKGDQLSRDPAVGEAYFSDPLVDLSGTARLGAALLGSMSDARESVGRIRVSALVIHGADDTVVPPAASAPLAAVPGVERKLFAGLRHEIHNEPERDDVLEFVADWLEQRLGTPG